MGQVTGLVPIARPPIQRTTFDTTCAQKKQQRNGPIGTLRAFGGSGRGGTDGTRDGLFGGRRRRLRRRRQRRRHLHHQDRLGAARLVVLLPGLDDDDQRVLAESLRIDRRCQEDDGLAVGGAGDADISATCWRLSEMKRDPILASAVECPWPEKRKDTNENGATETMFGSPESWMAYEMAAPMASSPSTASTKPWSMANGPVY